MAFVMEMIDKITGPSKRAAAALLSVYKPLQSQGMKDFFFGKMQRNALGQFTHRAGGLYGVMQKLKGAAGWLAPAFAVGGAAVAGAGVLAKVGTEMLVDSLTFQQSTKAAFSAIEGSQAQGETLYNHVLGMAKHFRQSPKDMMAAVLALRTAGLNTKDALSTVQSGMDLQALKPDTNIKALTLAIGQIKGKGKLEAEELNQLAESGGLAKDAVYRALIQIKGLSETDPTSLDKLHKMMRAGKVSAEEAIPAIQKAIATMTGVERAGEYADKARNSVASLINGLKAAPEQFLLRMSVEDGPLRKLLLMLNELFDPTTESGQRMLASLNKIGAQIMGIFGKMGTPENMQRIEKLVINLIKLLPIMISILAISLDVFITLFDAISNFGDNLAYVWRESNAFKGVIAALILVLSPAILALALLAAPFIAAGAAIYGAWLILKKFIDGIGTAVNGLAKLLGLQASLDTAKTGVADAVIAGGQSIAPPGSATPTPAAQLAGSKTANIQIGDISVKSVDGDNPTTKTVANDVAAKVRREITAAMRGAAGELG